MNYKLKKCKGSAIGEILLFLFLSALVGGIALKFISIQTKDLVRSIHDLALESELARALSVLYSSRQLAPAIFGNSLSRWHFVNLIEADYIRFRLENLPISSKPKENNLLLEVMETSTIIFSRDNYNKYIFTGEVQDNSLLPDLRERFWLITGPFINERWNTFPQRHFSGGNTWIVSFQASTPKVNLMNGSQHYSAETANNSENSPAIATPLLDHYVIYVTNSNELRRISLISAENQPVAKYINGITLFENGCQVSAKKNNRETKMEIPCQNIQSEPFFIMDMLDL
ncbi:MAG TPA: hypothetical protein PKA63_01340 [Oligoflexia bacterium]|nr:hypothetical protein [Oligoflexia bacterium]HMP47293.1 hypothetical protein [Oligoflexia bacterium]